MDLLGFHGADYDGDKRFCINEPCYSSLMKLCVFSGSCLDKGFMDSTNLYKIATISLVYENIWL